MSFLDRFKLQPRWKQADPAVRAAAVAASGSVVAAELAIATSRSARSRRSDSSRSVRAIRAR